MWTFIKEFFGIGLNNHVKESVQINVQQRKPVEVGAGFLTVDSQLKQIEDKLVEAVHTELTKTKTKKPKAQPKPKATKKNAKK